MLRQDRVLKSSENPVEHVRRTFIPAFGRHWALPLYDPFVKLIGGDRARSTLVEAAIRPGQRVLDVGCGTGSLAVLIKRLHPEVDVVGLDPDPRALARARRKAERATVQIRLDQGFSDALPYADASFACVLSSFMFHHLQAAEKAKTLHEVRRVLEPGGRLYLLDFGGPESDNAQDGILTLMGQAGFEDPKKVGGGSMVFGLVAYSCYAGSLPLPEGVRR
jgi:ubiquinone/menaquinone biosynthesis C-methylase UbiE